MFSCLCLVWLSSLQFHPSLIIYVCTKRADEGQGRGEEWEEEQVVLSMYILSLANHLFEYAFWVSSFFISGRFSSWCSSYIFQCYSKKRWLCQKTINIFGLQRLLSVATGTLVRLKTIVFVLFPWTYKFIHPLWAWLQNVSDRTKH